LNYTDATPVNGCYARELAIPSFDLNIERNDLLWLLAENSPQWVWDRRKSLVAERIFLRDF
jgi:hypothetical protein